MKHLTIIRIKNSDFDYTEYGLKNNYFSLDITTTVGYSKAVGVTQYAVLDGTTRMDNVSRQPAQITLQGQLGELRAGNNPEHYAYDTVIRNRLQNQMDLLEAIRDQAIFVDFITEERTYINQVITSCTFAKTNIGLVNTNITAREAIVFGDDISVSSFDSSVTFDAVQTSTILSLFRMHNVESDGELVAELNRVVVASTLSTPFIITMGPSAINPDVVMPAYPINKLTTGAGLPASVGQQIVVSDVSPVASAISGAELYTGSVVGGNSLHVTLPPLSRGHNLYSQRITLNESELYEYINIGSTPIHIRLKNGGDTVYSCQKTEVLKTPLFSDIVNGVHNLSIAGSATDIISTSELGLCFVRKQKNDEYTLLPNLLGQASRGYLYEGTYERTQSSISVILPILVYIHPLAWEKVKEELVRIWSESDYFAAKTLGGV